MSDIRPAKSELDAKLQEEKEGKRSRKKPSR